MAVVSQLSVEGGRWSSTCGVAVAVLVAVALLFNLPAGSTNASTLAAVFPPWWSQATIWRAGRSVGDVVDVGGSRFVLVLHSNAQGLGRRLKAAGALFVIDPRTLGPCGAGRGKEISS